ncbi:MAG: ABC transporter permease [Phycisphaerae bacterium]|nr:ABC transporter permease [Phycisphaerae bacterium]
MTVERVDTRVWLATTSLWRREMVRFVRQRSRIVGALATPMVFWLLLGSGLGRSFQAAGGPASHGYLEYFFPGTLVMILLFSAIFSTISVIEDRREGFLQGVLVAPVPRAAIVLGNVLGGTTLAVGQAGILLLFAPLVGFEWSFGRFFASIGVLVLCGLGLTSLGFAVAWRLTSTQGFHAIMNLVLVPMWMLSGAVFPPTGAPGWLRWVMAANPLSYGVVAVRRCLYPAEAVAAMGLASWPVALAVVVGFFGVMFVWCVRTVVVDDAARWS